MFVSEEHRFVYVTIPKCASHTMKAVLEEHYGAHQPLSFHHVQIPTPVRDYFTWTCVRHPFSRALSLWWRCLIQQDPYRWREQLGSDLSFESFAVALDDGRLRQKLHRRSAPYMAVPQAERLAHVRLDGVVHLERADEDFQALPFFNGKPGRLPVNNRSTGNTAGLAKGLTNRARLALTSWAADDFERFGYDRDVGPGE